MCESLWELVPFRFYSTKWKMRYTREGKPYLALYTRDEDGKWVWVETYIGGDYYA